MSGPIKVGDLVILVRPRQCCGSGYGFGEIFKVSMISTGVSRCGYCGHTERMILAKAAHHLTCGYNIKRLRKIDPPSEGETREAYVNLKQPRKVTA